MDSVSVLRQMRSEWWVERLADWQAGRGMLMLNIGGRAKERRRGPKPPILALQALGNAK
jgi:hypothetical protein